ncbi:helix-turn-helix transcriptional regulator [Rhodococcus sp. 105337]|uniref:helix-turn-helix domain-containing protein n=1 Tax=Rhodococcus sp. 105337 TaxID=2725310 RepID=UPI00146D8094|nr:helix-turn-helix transcriptional regulator [Rhodococcus sp. 105337]NME81504.1 helix-turn-helix transcriptional regulator [Rhodococcus sp. 105337]
MRTARESSGLTQHQLAARIGSTQSTVARWETGEHEVTMTTVSRVAEALGIEMLVRFGGGVGTK